MYCFHAARTSLPECSDPSPGEPSHRSRSSRYGTVRVATLGPNVHGLKYTENIVDLRLFDMRFPGSGHWVGHGMAGFSRLTMSHDCRYTSYFGGAGPSSSSVAGGYMCA